MNCDCHGANMQITFGNTQNPNKSFNKRINKIGTIDSAAFMRNHRNFVPFHFPSLHQLMAVMQQENTNINWNFSRDCKGHEWNCSNNSVQSVRGPRTEGLRRQLWPLMEVHLVVNDPLKTITLIYWQKFRSKMFSDRFRAMLIEQGLRFFFHLAL